MEGSMKCRGLQDRRILAGDLNMRIGLRTAKIFGQQKSSEKLQQSEGHATSQNLRP